MALAIIQPQDGDGRHVRLRIDIGTNKYYAYSIGTGRERVSTGAVRLLDQPVHRSPLMGPLPRERLGRSHLVVPRELFDRDNGHIQLFSFRTEQFEGPAVSDIVEVGIPVSPEVGFEDLPPPHMESRSMSALSSPRPSPGSAFRQEADATGVDRPGALTRPPTQVAAMDYREGQISQAMFIESIVGAIGSALPALGSFLSSNLPAILQGASSGSVGAVLPTIANMLPALLGGGAARAGAGAARAGGISPETIRAITELIQSAIGGRTGAPSSDVNVNQRTSASPQAGAGSGVITSPATERLAAQQSLARTLQRGGMSRAQALPLAALIPLIPQLLNAANGLVQLGLQADQQQMQHLERLNPGVNPQDLLALVGSLGRAQARPVRRLGSARVGKRSAAISRAVAIGKRHGLSEAQVAPLAALIPLIPQLLNSVRDLAQLGIAADRQLQEHLERLNPGVNPQDLFALLAQLSVDEPLVVGSTRFRASGLVRISLSEVTPTVLGAREWILYRHGRDLSFPVEVDTPRPLRRATLEVSITDPHTHRTVARRKHLVENLEPGRIHPSPTLRSSELSRLKPGAEALLTVSLVWKDSKGTAVGARTTRGIKLVEACTFNRFGEVGELIPLNNVQAHRGFWHRLWSGQFSDEQRRLGLDCKYYFAMEPDRAANARMETILDLEEDDVGEQTGRLRSGMVLSPDALNALIPQIAPSERELDEDELNAIRTSDFASRVGQVARAQLKFKAARGSAVALWMYPEVKLHTLVLNKAEAVADTGHIPEMTEVMVKFPLPSRIHLIGTSSEREE